MSDVFVSYAHVDSDFVELLRIKLEEAGINVWVDHTNLKAGTNWRTNVDEGIKNSIVLVLVMSSKIFRITICDLRMVLRLWVGETYCPAVIS